MLDNIKEEEFDQFSNDNSRNYPQVLKICIEYDPWFYTPYFVSALLYILLKKEGKKKQKQEE